jgi:hypothetical protein
MLQLWGMGYGCSFDPRSADDRPKLEGFISERDLDLAEGEFPGIASFYRQCAMSARPRPRTFLDLLTAYQVFRPER